MKSRMEIVAGIPVDQTKPATADIKKLLLEKLRIINGNRTVIEQAAIDKKKEEVLAAYKKAVDFEGKLEAIRVAQKAVKDADLALQKTGLSESGGLLTVVKKNRSGDKGFFIEDHSCREYPKLTKAEADRIEETRKLITAVGKSLDTFSTHDQLETRMMMASTVGECMAIVNAVADRDVFSIDTAVLKLEDKK